MKNRLEISVSTKESISYASWQNSVPLISEISIKNISSESFKDIFLNLKTTSGFLKPKTWRIESLSSGDDLSIRDCTVELDPEYLSGLNESEKSQVSFELSCQNELLEEMAIEVTVLARDEWGGLIQGGELIAAFVMPNDPEVSSLLKSTAKVLERHGHRNALDGYQSKDPKRSYLLISAMWNAICGMKLVYANPPKSFEESGQKVRTPQTISQQRLATCLDSSLLFASVIEAAGMNPVVVLTQGHCFVGGWLVDRTFGQVVENDISEVRKAIAANELLIFETTLVTHTPPAIFEQAKNEALAATRESQEADFVAVIDIARARKMAQIKPLASHSERKITDSKEAEELDPVFLPLAAAPSGLHVPVPILDENPTTPKGRIDRWQRKLLDLTLRNRLLNFKSTRKTIPIICNDVAKLEDLLAADKKLKLVSLLDQNPKGERDSELYRREHNKELDLEFAKHALGRKEIACLLTKDELEKRSVTLYRSVKNDLAEGGSNTLFLAVGFLRWKQKAGDRVTYKAPLMLMPVKLTRKSSQSPFYLLGHEDETRFNATLLQLLKQDFGKDLSVLETDLPTDESGVDVPQIFSQVRSHVREMSGFEVVEECALGSFSFAKYLLWRDLMDRKDLLKKNRVVKRLLDGSELETGSGSWAVSDPSSIDKNYVPAEIFHPLDADSSQLAAVMAVSEGKDLVLIGPPGTGKSQTIANMIAQCLANNKTVLFVAEKTAALDVVHRRLKQHGLGECCVEIHSNKTGRKEFLAQLEKSWKANVNDRSEDWGRVCSQLKERRDNLNKYVAELHKPHTNKWTAFRAFGVSSLRRNKVKPSFHWPENISHDEEDFLRLSSTAKELGVRYGEVAGSEPLPYVNATQWSVGWERELISSTEEMKKHSVELVQAIKEFAEEVGLSGIGDTTINELEKIKSFAASLFESKDEDVRLMFQKDFSKFPESLIQLREIIIAEKNGRKLIEGRYQNNISDIPAGEIENQWREACTKIWPLSWFAKRKVQRLLNTYADSSVSIIDPKADLQAISDLQKTRDALDENLLAGNTRHWNRAETDVDAVARQIDLAQSLRKAVKGLGDSTGSTSTISKSILPYIDGKCANHDLYKTARSFLQQLKNFYRAIKTFAGFANGMPVDKETVNVCQEAIDVANRVLANRKKLKPWILWKEIETTANSIGLNSLVQMMESSEISSDQAESAFEAGYADWFAARVVDKSETLRKFGTAAHENTIQEFKDLDQEARQLASLQSRIGIYHDLPTPEEVKKKSELGILRHQMQLKRPSKSIRDVVSSMPSTIQKIAPCMLMSPLSIAQYLPAELEPFDVVIFDEASQIPTWDAIGAIARGKQTVIVGDPKQLPPTNFFGKTDDEDEEDSDDDQKDLESILGEALSSGLPEMTLRWHYRSRHESLIAFSNFQYYHNELITFPSTDDFNKGLSSVNVTDGVYDKGNSRTNQIEAKAIVEHLVNQMQENMTLPESERRTFGVITFNMQQQGLIQDLLDDACRSHSELDWYFNESRIEPTVVKNLENVQGDERDVMYFSVTFGPTATDNRIGRNFGALNRDGGERRLNVAVTRARQQMLVFSSFTSDQLDVSGTKSMGLNHLKKFLAFAESSGEKPLGAEIEDSVGGFDSPFEEAVAEALEKKGWTVIPQIGVSGFRIDLGVRHPLKQGAFLAGVECDGATYHRSAVARDRDKIRQSVLEGLGWSILRVWSTDWWYASDEVAEKLDQQLQELLKLEEEKMGSSNVEIEEASGSS